MSQVLRPVTRGGGADATETAGAAAFSGFGAGLGAGFVGGFQKSGATCWGFQCGFQSIGVVCRAFGVRWRNKINEIPTSNGVIR